MKLIKNNFPSILKENEVTYFKHLEGIVASLDNGASISITKKPEGILVRITPSDYIRFNYILSEIKKIHTKFGIKVEFSKSMKSSNNICYNINF
jgi:hypothetical protein